MIVTVVDRAAMARQYGTSSFRGAVTRTVKISDHCPQCNEERGVTRVERFHEWGDYYEVTRWDNACGHVDMYPDVLAEAALLDPMPEIDWSKFTHPISDTCTCAACSTRFRSHAKGVARTIGGASSFAFWSRTPCPSCGNHRLQKIEGDPEDWTMGGDSQPGREVDP